MGDGIGGRESPVLVGAGRRNGKDPEGDAWLFEGLTEHFIPENLRKACHAIVVKGLLDEIIGKHLVPAISDSWD